MMTQERTEIALEDRWNVEALYPSLEEWNKDFMRYQEWPKLETFKGRLAEGPKTILELLKYYLEAESQLIRLYTYAHLRHDEDVAHDLHKQIFIKITILFQKFREAGAWIEPELLHLPDATLTAYLNSPELAPYKNYLEKIVRFKPHILSVKEEELLAASGLALETPERAFGAFNNADMKFPEIVDSQGKKHELTHGKYTTYLRSQDRVLRENAFKTMQKSFLAYENTLCELINGEVQKHLFFAKARKFRSCLEAALFPHQVDESVYLNLIQTVRDNLSSLHQYMKLRKKLLKVDELHMWDLHVPLLSSIDIKMEYPEAEKVVIESVALLGEKYQRDLQAGLKEQRWVDRYENARKRSGAYSSGCWGSMPYILMNYHGHLHDVMTLSHEAGHSMHSLLSWRSQPYQDASYPIFVAEVASTFHEELLLRHLLSQMPEKTQRAFLINQKIEDIRSTFFRQTMFAEFELKLHQLAEQGIPLTPTLLKSEYRKLNLDYFGPDVVVDPEIDIEWARIPHFYYNFYVYQYATGIAAAHSLVEIVEKQGPQNYLQFLSSGGSKYPLDLLLTAGVDMRKPAPIATHIHQFEHLTTELANLI